MSSLGRKGKFMGHFLQLLHPPLEALSQAERSCDLASLPTPADLCILDWLIPHPS